MRGEEFLGRLRERVRFEEEFPMPDGLGGVTRIWREAATIWAAIEMTAAGGKAAAKQWVRPLRYDVVVRRPAGLSPAWRLNWHNRRLTIKSMEQVEGRPELVWLRAEEETPQ